MKADTEKFKSLMNFLIPLLDDWSITEYKIQQMQAKQFSVPEGLINHKKSIINQVESAVMEYNEPELKKLNQ